MTRETSSVITLLTDSVRHFVRDLEELLINHHSNQSEPPSVSETLELLAHERRRLILEELAVAEETPLTTSTLADRVAAAEYDCRPKELSPDQQKRVYIALVQSHLPKYSDAEVIAHLPDECLVDRGPKFVSVWQTYRAICETLT